MTKSTEPRKEEWHVRRQRPDARTTLVWFIDADANRLTVGQFLEQLETSESFRSAFTAAIAESEARTFVWEMPALSRTTLAAELECALTEAPIPKKVKIDPAKFAAHFGPNDLAAAFAEGEATFVAPSPKQTEGWYADLPTFLRRIRPAQVHALWQTFARAARAAVGPKPIWLSSSAPGAAWLHLRIEPTAKNLLYARYVR